MRENSRIYYSFSDPADIFPLDSSHSDDWQREYKDGLLAIQPVTSDSPDRMSPVFGDALDKFVASIPSFSSRGQSVKDWVLRYAGFRPLMQMESHLTLAHMNLAEDACEDGIKFVLEKLYSVVGFDAAKQCVYCHAEGFFSESSSASQESIEQVSPLGNPGIVARVIVTLGAGGETQFNTVSLSHAAEIEGAASGVTLTLPAVFEKAGYTPFEEETLDNKARCNERDYFIVEEEKFVRAYRVWHQCYSDSSSKLLLNKAFWELNNLLKGYMDNRYQTGIEKRSTQAADLKSKIDVCLGEESTVAFKDSLQRLSQAADLEKAYLTERQEWIGRGHLSIPNPSETLQYFFTQYPLLRRIENRIRNYLNRQHNILNFNRTAEVKMAQDPCVYQAQIILTLISRLEKMPPSYADYCFVLGEIFKIRNAAVPAFPLLSQRSLLVDILDSVLPQDGDGGERVQHISQSAGEAIRSETERLLHLRQAHGPATTTTAGKAAGGLIAGAVTGLVVGTAVGILLGGTLYCTLNLDLTIFVPAILSCALGGMLCAGASDMVVGCRQGHVLRQRDVSPERAQPLLYGDSERLPDQPGHSAPLSPVRLGLSASSSAFTNKIGGAAAAEPVFNTNHRATSFLKG